MSTTPEQALFITAWQEISQAVHDNARNKGFWDGERNDGEAIALIHSELSEALEALRKGNPPDDKVPTYSGAEAELADVVIRIMDLAEGRGWRVVEAIVAKMAFNETRSGSTGRSFDMERLATIFLGIGASLLFIAFALNFFTFAP